MIKLIRVDYRLLHGQVAVSWTGMLGADLILLVSDTLDSDPIRKKSILLGRPTGVKVVHKTVNDAIEAVESGITDKYEMLVVCETIRDAYEFIQHTKVKALNLGNIPFSENTEKISQSVFVSNEEMLMLSELVKKGISVFSQSVPTERKKEFNIKKGEK